MSINGVAMDGEAEISPRQRKSLTLSDRVIEIGERLARDENRNFSNYVETLILRDAKRGDVEPESAVAMSPREATAAAAEEEAA